MAITKQNLINFNHSKTRAAVLLTGAFSISLLAGCGSGGGSTNPPPPPPPPPPPTRIAERVAFVGPDMANQNAANDFVHLGLDDRQAQENIILSNFPSGSVVTDMQFSLDGDYLAFLAGPNLVDTNLYVFSFDTGEAMRANAESSIRYVSSFDWSPDSAQLAYAFKSVISDVEFVLIVNRDGTNDRRISTENSSSFSVGNPRFSPDGRYVLLESSRVINNNAASVPNALSFVDLNAATIRSVTLTAANQVVKEAEWSSSSKTVCYIMNNERAGNPEIFRTRVSNVSTTSPNSSIISDNSDFFGDCSWSADGRSLAFTEFDNGLARGLQFTDINSDTTDFTTPQDIVRLTNSSIIEFAWAPGSNDNLAYIAAQETATTATIWELFHTSKSGGTQTKLNVDLAATNRDVLEFEWSPDGTKVAYTADNETDTVEDLYVSNADGSNKIRISDFASGEEVRDFHWSADSTRIAFTSGPPGRTVIADKVYAATADGSEFVQVNTLVVGAIRAIEYAD